MKHNFKISLILLGNLMLTGSLFPETIILKTGKTFFGRVIEQNRDLNTKEIKQIIDVETKKNQPSLNQVTETNEKFDPNSKNRIKRILPMKSQLP
ncbi:hypothetical protein [Leptospira levettii]|uniref:hypothetical protein n=1 Tax=Leptospira levettii TaxID=2023178 RepID=UPI001FEF8714|nr:hypothetical protein [Leptospira levettii]